MMMKNPIDSSISPIYDVILINEIEQQFLTNIVVLIRDEDQPRIYYYLPARLYMSNPPLVAIGSLLKTF